MGQVCAGPGGAERVVQGGGDLEKISDFVEIHLISGANAVFFAAASNDTLGAMYNG
jgi:hypothetical protein